MHLNSFLSVLVICNQANQFDYNQYYKPFNKFQSINTVNHLIRNRLILEQKLILCRIRHCFEIDKKKKRLDIKFYYLTFIIMIDKKIHTLIIAQKDYLQLIYKHKIFLKCINFIQNLICISKLKINQLSEIFH